MSQNYSDIAWEAYQESTELHKTAMMVTAHVLLKVLMYNTIIKYISCTKYHYM